MATKIARLLFVGVYKELGTLEEDRRPGPHTAPEHCSLHGSDK